MNEEQGKSWRCAVCGYVHRDGERPPSCPVCGASADDFEPLAGTAAAPARPAAGAVSARRCLVCGYVQTDGEPDAACAVCGAGPDCFEADAGEAPAAGAPPAGDGPRIVIVGGGIAGVAAMDAALSVSPGARVTLLAKEQFPPYYRLNLTRYLAGEVAARDLSIHPPEWYERRGAAIETGVEAVSIDLAGRSVTLRDGRALPWDRLVLACGAHPFLPPIPGAYREGVRTLRTVEDADRILALAKTGTRVVCIGGGVLGLETAAALAARGAKVTVVESFPWLLPRQLDRRAGELLEGRIRALGIATRTGAKVEEIAGDECARGVALAGEGVLPADLVVVAAGVRPNSYLARAAGIRVNQGVVVDRFLATSAKDVYAAGDVAEFEGTVYGLWNPARFMGGIAGRNAAGVPTEFGGMPRSNTLKVLGVDLFSVGRVEADDGSYLEAAREAGDDYARFLLRDGRLVGAILLGDPTLGARAKQAVEAGEDFSAAVVSGRACAERVIARLKG